VGLLIKTYDPEKYPMRAESDLEKFYSARVAQYDENMHLTFEIQGLDELSVRSALINKLRIRPGVRVLEIGVGTGRDSEILLRELTKKCESSFEYVGCDVSYPMLEFCRKRISEVVGDMTCISLHQASAINLPFDDSYFDSVYSFGSICEVPDIRRALAEIARVAKDGAQIMLADEGVPLHLRATPFYRYLSFTNPAFSYVPPIDLLPESSRDLELSWCNNNTFFVLNYVENKSEIEADFDRLIPGERGGSLKTRVEGQLCGVDLALKQKFTARARELGLSDFDFLNKILGDYLDK
jgi:ubiquinone/menaquinone biosynthesis C-methylase UbiE